ncbi:MAG: hypothetical protein ACYDBH_10965 [Acidobacteriaceae bacterium]
MNSYAKLGDVSISAAAGLFCGAIGSTALAARFFHEQIWPPAAWSMDFLISVVASAIGCGIAFGVVAYLTIPPTEKHERGTEIHKL